MLFVSDGTLPDPLGPPYDRWSMARALVAHARIHLDLFNRHTQGLFFDTTRSPGSITLLVRPATPLPADVEMLLEVESKHAVEDLRSSLEYLAMEIFEQVCCHDSGPQPHEHRSVTFPVPTPQATLEQHVARVAQVFPGLRETNRPLFDLLAGCWTFTRGDTVWLDTIQTVWNEVKHRRLDRLGVKPMTLLFPGVDARSARQVPLLYFPRTSRGIAPNLHHAIVGVQDLLAQSQRLLSPTQAGPTT
jgi:hypothetical protein